MLLPKIAIFLLWLGAVIDPIGNMYGIRYLALATAFAAIVGLFTLGRFQQLFKSYRGILILLISVLLPAYGLILYAFNAGSDDFIDTSYLASGVLIITSLLYHGRSMCEYGVKSFIFSTRLVSLIIIAGYVSSTFSHGEWVSFFTERNVALVSFREYAGITFPYIYFLASPLLIFLIAYDFNKFKQTSNVINFFIFTLTSSSLVLTGTRAHMVLGVIFAPLYIILTGNYKTIIKTLILLAIVALFTLTVTEGGTLINSFFDTSETSNSMKLSLLDGYGEIFSNLLRLFFGQGFNAHEWSSILRGMIAMEDKASKTELTYLELVRVFGVIIATTLIITIVLLLKSTKNLGGNFQWIYPGFTIFLINATVNPYLFSVNGMLPLGLISAIVYQYSKNSKKHIIKI